MAMRYSIRAASSGRLRNEGSQQTGLWHEGCSVNLVDFIFGGAIEKTIDL